VIGSFSYVVRVVSTDMNTLVTWQFANNVSSRDNQVVDRGHFVQIRNELASQVMLVHCDKPCLVMQYNPGTA